MPSQIPVLYERDEMERVCCFWAEADAGYADPMSLIDLLRVRTKPPNRDPSCDVHAASTRAGVQYLHHVNRGSQLCYRGTTTASI
jgi:hypothetical protein